MNIVFVIFLISWYKNVDVFHSKISWYRQYWKINVLEYTIFTQKQSCIHVPRVFNKILKIKETLNIYDPNKNVYIMTLNESAVVLEWKT